MSIIDGTFDFQLTTPIEYPFGGQIRQGTFVTFFEPGGPHTVPALRMRNIFQASFPKMAELGRRMAGIQEQSPALALELKKPHEVDDRNVETDLGEMLLMVDDFDIEGFLASFDKLLTMNNKKVAAKINNELPFTAALIDELSPEDHFNMAAAYVNFTLERSKARKSGIGKG